jgi:hypothetical protein
MALRTWLTLVIVSLAAAIGGSLGRKGLFERDTEHRSPADSAPPRAPRPIDWF